jgi:hypothetical protein
MIITGIIASALITWCLLFFIKSINSSFKKQEDHFLKLLAVRDEQIEKLSNYIDRVQATQSLMKTRLQKAKVIDFSQH